MVILGHGVGSKRRSCQPPSTLTELAFAESYVTCRGLPRATVLVPILNSPSRFLLPARLRLVLKAVATNPRQSLLYAKEKLSCLLRRRQVSWRQGHVANDMNAKEGPGTGLSGPPV